MKKIFAAVVTIIILTASVAMAFTPAGPKYDTPYIGNSLRGSFHRRDCQSLWKINPDNQVPFKTRDEAIAAGYHPCGNCKS